MKLYGSMAVLALLFAALQVSAATQLDVDSQKFLQNAAQGNINEIAMGKLGLQQAKSDDVKAFANTLITDHTAALDSVKALAAQHNVALPTEVDSQGKAMADRLGKRTGVEFDVAFLGLAITDHRKDIKDFQAQVTSARNEDIRAFAQKTLPVLEKHLTMATNVLNQMKASAKASGLRSHRPVSTGVDEGKKMVPKGAKSY
jgi:putative membrane protein